MSILNDHEIIARCVLPMYFYVEPEGPGKTDRGIYTYSEYKGVGVHARVRNIPPELQGYLFWTYPNDMFEGRPWRTEITNENDQARLLEYWRPMISPVCETQVKKVEGNPVISYGTSSFGYDLRVGNHFRVFKEPGDHPELAGHVIDPKNVDEALLDDVETDVLIIPPHGFALGVSKERIAIPRDIMTVCLGKSTYARTGLIVNVTPFEPEWEGYVTLEFSNTTPWPAKIYANEGVTQVLFFQGKDCGTSYADRFGKYQDQPNVPVVSRI